jgi:hypothetical protein
MPENETKISDEQALPDRPMVTRYAVERAGLRWVVVESASFPDGICGVRIRPFVRVVARCWRWSAAFALAEAFRHVPGSAS